MFSIFKKVFSGNPSGGEFARQFDDIEKFIAKQHSWYGSEINEEPAASSFLHLKQLDGEPLKRAFWQAIEKRYYFSTAGKYNINAHHTDNHNWAKNSIYSQLLMEMLKKKPPFDEKELEKLLGCLHQKTNFEYTDWELLKETVRLLEKMFRKAPAPELVKQALKHLVENAIWFDENSSPYYGRKESDAYRQRILDIINPPNTSGEVPSIFLIDTDDFGTYTNHFLQNLPHETQQRWFALLHVLKKTSGSQPSAKFLKEMKAALDSIPDAEKELTEHIRFLANLDVKTEQKVYKYDNSKYPDYVYQTHTWVVSGNEPFAKGLVWAASLFSGNELAALLAKLAERRFKKYPGSGAICPAIGNAACYALGQMDNPAAVSYLSALKVKPIQNNTKALIDKFIGEAATRLGVTMQELEDGSVQDFGLEDGKRTFEIGGYLAEISLQPNGKVELQWFNAEGKMLKSAPSALKNGHKNELKELKIVFDLIQKTLTAQRQRLDRMYIEDRSWKLSRFEKIFLHHVLLGNLTKRLIWLLEENGNRSSCFWKNGTWLNAKGEPVGWLSPETTVRLWHPCTDSTEATLAWREAIEHWEMVQPFKQAYREIYLLTEAELNTMTYSNRMAAHFVRQHQFASLARGRGWSYQLLGAWDSPDTGAARIKIPAYSLSAEFWTDAQFDSADHNDTGIWTFVVTDQVRFCRNGETEPVRLLDIPPIVFSEIMRDADLFVGVGSVGNDPTWNDMGDQRMQTYWQSYSFGDLGEMAKTRKAILEKLLPKLKIAKVAELRDKFLVVKGNRRTYKIHIGSTNILMEPNDQYLCIVEKRNPATPGNLFLQFEGDHGLSVLLSKAFLLAEDDKITDTTILSQLERK
jgi:hypothetical protein